MTALLALKVWHPRFAMVFTQVCSLFDSPCPSYPSLAYKMVSLREFADWSSDEERVN